MFSTGTLKILSWSSVLTGYLGSDTRRMGRAGCVEIGLYLQPL